MKARFFLILSECEVKYSSRFLIPRIQLPPTILFAVSARTPLKVYYDHLHIVAWRLNDIFFPPAAHGLSSNNLQYYWLLWRKPVQNNSGSGKPCVWNQGLIRDPSVCGRFHFSHSWIPYHRRRKRWFRRRNLQSNLRTKVFILISVLLQARMFWRSVHIFGYINSFLMISNSFAYINKK